MNGVMCSIMDAEALKEAVSPLLRAHGFKRSGTTWRRDQVESIAVLNVQKSQWGGGTYYINLGTYFRTLGNDTSPTENKCHVRVRLNPDTPSKVVDTAVAWFDARAGLREAALLAEGDSKQGLVCKEVRLAAST
jgi:hypothetical protein